MIEKKASLAKAQQITDLEEKFELTSTLSSGQVYINTYSTMTLNIKGTDCGIFLIYSTIGTHSVLYFPEMLFEALEKIRTCFGFSERH